jgi:RNA polymerase sigma-70 factor, ECF subfamily
MFAPIEGSWKTLSNGNVGFAAFPLSEINTEMGTEDPHIPTGITPAMEAGTEVLADRGEQCPIEPTNEAPHVEAPEAAASSSECAPESEDQKLVEMARLGDTAAFNELIKKNYATCLKRATFMIRNRNDAEDEVQNACWKAFQHLEQFRGEGTFSAWLSRIVENQCLMRIREERKSSFVYLDESTESNVRLELVGQRANPEDELGEQQVVNLVRREISLIPPLLRNVMLLRDVEQLPMPDVASRLGVSVPAAKSRLMRARAELRLRVAKHCGPKGCATLTHRSRYKQAAYLRAS